MQENIAPVSRWEGGQVIHNNAAKRNLWPTGLYLVVTVTLSLLVALVSSRAATAADVGPDPGRDTGSNSEACPVE